jgi:hypothetical protein
MQTQQKMHLKQGFALMQSLTKLKWSWSATHSMLSPSLCERANNLKTLKRAKGRGRTLRTNEWDRKETLIMFIIWCYDDLLRCRSDRAISLVSHFQRKNQTDERETERERFQIFKWKACLESRTVQNSQARPELVIRPLISP